MSSVLQAAVVKAQFSTWQFVRFCPASATLRWSISSEVQVPVLLELRIENYAVIDSLAVEFAPGLNLLTGDTGAGKSILIDALSLLLGDKASSDMLRHGAEKMVVSGVFEVEDRRTKDVLEKNGIEPEEGQVLIKRE